MCLVSTVVIVVLMVFVMVVPLVPETAVAVVARLAEFMAIVVGLLAIRSVAIDVMLQPVLPFVDVPPAGRDIVVIRSHDRRGSQQQQTAS